MQNVVLELRAKLKAETRVILMVQLLNYHQRSQMLGLSTHVLLMVLDCYYTKTKDSANQLLSLNWETEFVLLQKIKYTKMIDDPFSFYKLMK
jgi:hypothetical protein